MFGCLPFVHVYDNPIPLCEQLAINLSTLDPSNHIIDSLIHPLTYTEHTTTRKPTTYLTRWDEVRRGGTLSSHVIFAILADIFATVWFRELTSFGKWRNLSLVNEIFPCFCPFLDSYRFTFALKATDNILAKNPYFFPSHSRSLISSLFLPKDFSEIRARTFRSTKIREKV